MATSLFTDEQNVALLAAVAQAERDTQERCASVLLGEANRIQKIQRREGFDINRSKTIAKLKNLAKHLRSLK